MMASDLQLYGASSSLLLQEPWPVDRRQLLCVFDYGEVIAIAGETKGLPQLGGRHTHPSD